MKEKRLLLLHFLSLPLSFKGHPRPGSPFPQGSSPPNEAMRRSLNDMATPPPGMPASPGRGSPFPARASSPSPASPGRSPSPTQAAARTPFAEPPPLPPPEDDDKEERSIRFADPADLAVRSGSISPGSEIRRGPWTPPPDPDPTIELPSRASLNEVKCALLDVVYRTSRGVTATLDQRAQVRTRRQQGRISLMPEGQMAIVYPM